MRFSVACIKVLGYVTECKFGMVFFFLVMCRNVPVLLKKVMFHPTSSHACN